MIVTKHLCTETYINILPTCAEFLEFEEIYLLHTYEILTAAKDHLLCFVTLPAYYRKLVPSFILFTNKVYRYNTPNSSRFYLPFPYIIRKFFVTYQDPVSL